MEAENSFTLTIYSSVNLIIALGCPLEMIMGFHEYTYQDREYLIRTGNTMHAQCTCFTVLISGKLHHTRPHSSYCWLAQRAKIQTGRVSFIELDHQNVQKRQGIL